ncbi:MAG: hypothetical protein PUE02_01620 [Eggerthellaceae bacterium]|nr:hypothetical protein [Eggerthellaceae bacterium]
MYVSDHQSVAVVWHDRCIGKLACKWVTLPGAKGVKLQTWEGTVLNVPMKVPSLVEADVRIRVIMANHGIAGYRFENGDAYRNITIPPTKG